MRVAAGRKPERRPRQLHGLPGAAERARDVIERGGIDPLLGEQVAQHLAAMRAPVRGRAH